MNTPTLKFNYTNHRGDTADREVSNPRMWYGKNDYHAEEQWFIVGFDVEKKSPRTFAVKSIHKFYGETQ